MKRILIVTLAMFILIFSACSGPPQPSPTPTATIASTLPVTPSLPPSVTPSASASPAVSPITTVTPAPTSTATQTAPPSGVFQLKDGSMSVSVPKGWEATDMSSEVISLGILYSGNKTASIIILSMALPEGSSNANMDEIYKTSIENSLPGGKITKQSDVTVSRIKGRQLELTAKVNKQDMRGIMAVFVNNNKLYTITGVTAKADYGKYEKTFLDAIKSSNMK